MKIKYIDKESGSEFASFDVSGKKPEDIIVILEASLVSAMAYEKNPKDILLEVPEEVYGECEKEFGWAPEEGRRETLFSIPVEWKKQEKNEA